MSSTSAGCGQSPMSLSSPEQKEMHWYYTWNRLQVHSFLCYKLLGHVHIRISSLCYSRWTYGNNGVTLSEWIRCHKLCRFPKRDADGSIHAPMNGQHDTTSGVSFLSTWWAGNQELHLDFAWCDLLIIAHHTGSVSSAGWRLVVATWKCPCRVTGSCLSEYSLAWAVAVGVVFPGRVCVLYKAKQRIIHILEKIFTIWYAWTMLQCQHHNLIRSQGFSSIKMTGNFLGF